MKKVKIIVLTLIVALLTPTSAFASTNSVKPFGPGEWDQLYYNNLYLTTSSFKEIQVNSGGGNLEVCAFNMNSLNNGRFTIDEKDPSGRDWIGGGFFSPDKPDGNCRVMDVDPYVDGSNNKAELVIGFKVNGFNESVSVRVRD